ncbi:MAG: hypothetical protein AAF871_13095 [Pseudomonadota bacterium]
MKDKLSPRLERYAACLAAERGTQLECWCNTADNGPLPQTNGRQVSASRAARRVADRVIQLKAELAKAKAPPPPLNPEEISALMRDISNGLLNAARVVAAHGHESLASRIRKSAITHSGRRMRTSRFIGEISKAQKVNLDEALDRLPVCDCS